MNKKHRVFRRTLCVAVLLAVTILPSTHGFATSATHVTPPSDCAPQSADGTACLANLAVAMWEDWDYDLNKLSSGVRGSLSAPSHVLDGQKFPVGIMVTADNPIEGAVVQVLPSIANLDGARCSATDITISGGTPLGQSYYLIAPKTAGLLFSEDSPIPTGSLRIDWILQATNPGRCLFTVEINNPANPLPIPDLETLVGIIPDITLTPVNLGHIQTLGGQTSFDGAVVVSPASAGEVHIKTAGETALTVVGAIISHHDGLSYEDWGEFEITPGADLGLLKKIAPFLTGIVEEVAWTMELSDDGEKIPWKTVVSVPAAPATEENPKGLASDVCLRGQYVDSGKHKGQVKLCVTVYAEQVGQALLLDNEGSTGNEAADAILSRTGAAFFAVGQDEYAFVMPEA